MFRIIGFAFLLIGGALLYHGWQTQDSVPANTTLTTDASASIWYLAAGAVAVVWGLCALLRRSPG